MINHKKVKELQINPARVRTFISEIEQQGKINLNELNNRGLNGTNKSRAGKRVERQFKTVF